MLIEIGVLGGIIMVFLAIMTLYLTRVEKACKATAESTAQITGLQKDIEHLTGAVNTLSARLDEHNKRTDDSIRRMHDRQDDHVRDYHSKAVKGG